MRRITAEGRLPASMKAEEQYSLYAVFRDITTQLNDLTDHVMAKANHSSAITADGLVKTGRCTYRGFHITVVTATAAIDIRDGVSAGTGTVIDTIPAATAAGTRVEKTVGINCETGLYVDFGASATGTVIVLFE